MSIPAPVPAGIATRVEALCLALPEVTVRVDGWARSFDIRRRSFCLVVAVDAPQGDPVPLLVLRSDPDERNVLLAIGHPYYPSRAGTDRIQVIVDAETDWDEIRELVIESYRQLAPNKLIARLE